MTKRGGLGRGLAALIPTRRRRRQPAPESLPAGRRRRHPAPTVSRVPPPGPRRRLLRGRPRPASRGTGGALGVPGAQLREVSVDNVVPNPKQPRQVFDDEALDELTYSVKEFGLLQPIVVRENGPAGGYELIMGERRLRAARAAGLDVVPAIVRDTTDDALLRDALLENIHRVQLNPLEEAAAYQQLLEEFGATHEELASKIGRSRSQVTNTIRLLKLPVKVQTRVAAGVISAGHARALLGAGRRPGAGRARDPDRRRGHVGARHRGGGRDGRRRAPGHQAAHPADLRPRCRGARLRLSDMFETKVQIQIGRSKGKIVVEFGSVDDLQRIIGVMAPEITGRRPEA